MTAAIPFSVLDLAPIPQGNTPHDAFQRSLALAQHVEQWGYQRYWLAEHHNMPGIASSATAVLMGFIASGTQHIRVGSGGVMLPNHAPLVIAEQFGTLASLYPNRIELGLGRAPGTDPTTMRALRRHLDANLDDFPRDVQELLDYLGPEQPDRAVRAVPGQGLNIPVWLLGSSLYSAQLAAAQGLPFAFAAHFAPDMLLPALQLYRDNFKASGSLSAPYSMVCVNVVTADSEQEAQFLYTSLQQQFINLRRGTPGPLPAPVENMSYIWTPGEKFAVEQTLRLSVVGDRQKVRHGLQALLRETQADELMINGQIFDHQARLHSFRIVAELREELAKEDSMR
ncbi:luciferase-like monooxygenase [Musicola keenii]|uniref:luciferase-like monooxygenase n=1 Tax=Musicola keenii TaxID=2884250 RepID=UPI0017869D96|nr:luciferase-like monooxygenase [Musicola keenii]